ncbi:uncharacterized protein knl1 [Stigmatopora argus]
MDPSDNGKNDENTGCYSNRRISSILKAPRKSVRFQDSEQWENEVQCAKPEKNEKRNSRRVSFAPANDVLLFSKDVKNGSPVRTPFQELMSTVEPIQKSVQVLRGEDENQEIIGIPQINTPLHATELNGKDNFENGQGFGEKTVVYSEDDVFMEMTQSHSVNISYNGLLNASQSHPNTLNACENKTIMSSAKRETMLIGISHNMSTGGTTDFRATSSVSALKPSSNSLLSLSKSCGSNGTLLETSHAQVPQIKSQTVDLNKENQAPSFQVYLEKEKSGHNGMDITTTHAELEDDDDDDDDNPFQCLFPSKKMYSQSDIVSQSRHTPKTPHKQTSMMEGLSNQKAVFGIRFDKENAEDYLQITDPISLKNQSSAASQQQMCNSKQKCTEKTWSTADDACMDMTQSSPVKIMNELSSSPTPNLGISLSEGKMDISASSMEKKNKETAQTVSSDIVLDPKFKHFLTALFKPECQKVTSGDAGMTQMKEANEQPFIGHSTHPKEDQRKLMTTFQKVSVLENTGSDEPIQCPLPIKKIQPEVGQTIFQQALSARQRSSYISGKEMPLKVNDQIISSTQEDCREQSVGFSAVNPHLDSTQRHTVNMAPVCTLQSRGNERTMSLTANNIDTPFDASSLQRAYKKFPCDPSVVEKTIRFSASDAGMDMTQTFNAVIVTPFESQTHANANSVTVGGEETIRFSVNNAMDMTQALPGTIDIPFETGAYKDAYTVPYREEETIRFLANDAAMDVTQNVTAAINTPGKPGAQKIVNSVIVENEKTIRFSGDDAPMEMTESLTAKIDAPLEPGTHEFLHSATAGGEKTNRFSIYEKGIDNPFGPEAYKHVYSVPYGEEKTIRFFENGAAMDMTQNLTAAMEMTQNLTAAMDMTQCHAAPMEMTQNLTAAMDMTQCHTAAMDMTQCHTAPMEMTQNLTAAMEMTQNLTAAMDMTQNLTAAIYTSGKAETRRILNSLSVEENTIRFSENEAGMDLTQGFTAKFDPPNEPEAEKYTHVVTGKGEKNIRFSKYDAAMDMTQSLTAVNDAAFKDGDHKNIHSVPVKFSANCSEMHFTPNINGNIAAHLEPGTHHNGNILPDGGENTCRFTTNDTGMDITGTLTTTFDNAFEQKQQQNANFTSVGKEKTVSNSVNGTARDLTRNITANLTHLEPAKNQNCNFLTAGKKNILRSSANDAVMEVRGSFTTQNETPFAPVGGKKRQFFSANDAVMDTRQRMTSHLEPGLHFNEPKGAEKTTTFSAMDEIQSHVTNSDEYLQTGLHQNVNFNVEEQSMKLTENVMEVTQGKALNAARPPQNTECFTYGEEKTIKCNTNDISMDITRSHTVNITNHLLSGDVPHAKKQDELQRKRSLSILNFNRGQNNYSMITKADPPAEPCFGEALETNGSISVQPKTNYVDNKYKVPGVETLCRSPLSKLKKMDGSFQVSVTDLSLKLEEVDTGYIFGKKCSNEPPQFESTKRYTYADVHENMEFASEKTCQELELSYQDVDERTDTKGPEAQQSMNETALGNETIPLSQNLCSPNSGDHDKDSRQSRRVSLVDIQSKLRRLTSTSVSIASDICNAPLPNLDSDTNKNTKESNVVVPEMVPDVQTSLENTLHGHKEHDLQENKTVATPFKSKTTELRSRLSLGTFMPKFPQRKRAHEIKNADSSYSHSQEKSGYRTAIDKVTDKLNKWNEIDVSDINDEELGSCEDLSETLDLKSPPKISAVTIPIQEHNIDKTLLENDFQENSTNGNTEHEKETKSSDQVFQEAVETGMQPVVLEYDGVNSTTLPTKSNQTMDSSSSTHTNSTHSDGSTFKHSMSDSHFEDSDVQKLENGTLTMLQFFQLFSIDFVIHKPRQSISHGKLPYTTGCSPMVVLKNRHINHPQKMVYEGNLEMLSENVEGMYSRMMHLNKPLNVINKCLWKEMKKCSEKEISTFGVKLKERNNFFRKMSKVRSHEMKEDLYSNLAQAITDEQEKLKSKVAQSDEMIKILDGCICDLEAEIATVEDKGTQNRASLKSLEEEIKNANDTLGDKKRQIYEVELQKEQASRKLDILKNETKSLQGFVKMLNIVTEWRFEEKTDNHTLYTFLYDTLHLQVVHKGNCAEKEPERKTSHINFKFLLDEEKSQDHTRLVHKLLSQYIESETAWVEKYPTYGHVPKLLHDVSLVMSHCRLLGEEIRLMRMWGGLRLNIVDISCVDTRVNIIFSSVKRLSRFEVTLSVSLVNHFYVVQLQAFNNFFGDATACQIEQILESFSPAKKLLTKIVKKINCDLLC